MTDMGKLMMAAAAGAMVATPAMADIKAGADAWTRGDYRTAIDQWRAPAIAGDPVAQYNMGQAYKLGRGVPVDPALAESWFRKAALQGLAQGEDNYGLALFQAGKKADAVPWLEKSVARAEPRAQLVLGTMLFNGDGVPRDVPRAYALMSRASAAGLQSAQATLAQMDDYVSPADRERGTALAQQYAAQARGMPTDLQNGRVTEAVPMRVADVVSPRAAVIDKPAPVTATLSAKKIAKLAAVPTGRWRIQLGAFSTQANAQTQWNQVRAHLTGAQPNYAKAGNVVRLQVGPYPGRAEAQRACAASGTTCMVVAP